MSMTRLQLAAIALALVVVVGGWFLLAGNNGGFLPGTVRPSTLTGAVSDEKLPARYENEEFGFSLNMPEGFSGTALPRDENGGTAIILQNKQGEGIQIYVTPAAGETTLTADDIRAGIPDMQVEEPEVVEIGDQYRGVAFLSDNAAFGGDSREVWFYFRGNLYQISTYTRLDSLLKAMFATWQFS